MTVEVIIPWSHAATYDRHRAFDHVHDWYREHDYSVRTNPCPVDPWAKGAAVDAAVKLSPARVLVIADADVLVPVEALQRSVLAVTCGAAWSQPHGEVFRLSQDTTARVYTEALPGRPRWLPRRALANRQHTGPHGGGIVVLTRDAYDTVGGIDPRFVGWGGEDISFARALDTLVGPCLRFDAPMWHFWHERQERRPGNRASSETEQLANAYLAACGHRDRMRALVACRG